MGILTNNRRAAGQSCVSLGISPKTHVAFSSLEVFRNRNLASLIDEFHTRRVTALRASAESSARHALIDNGAPSCTAASSASSSAQSSASGPMSQGNITSPMKKVVKQKSYIFWGREIPERPEGYVLDASAAQCHGNTAPWVSHDSNFIGEFVTLRLYADGVLHMRGNGRGSGWAKDLLAFARVPIDEPVLDFGIVNNRWFAITASAAWAMDLEAGGYSESSTRLKRVWDAPVFDKICLLYVGGTGYFTGYFILTQGGTVASWDQHGKENGHLLRDKEDGGTALEHMNFVHYPEPRVVKGIMRAVPPGDTITSMISGDATRPGPWWSCFVKFRTRNGKTIALRNDPDVKRLSIIDPEYAQSRRGSDLRWVVEAVATSSSSSLSTTAMALGCASASARMTDKEKEEEKPIEPLRKSSRTASKSSATSGAGK